MQHLVQRSTLKVVKTPSTRNRGDIRPNNHLIQPGSTTCSILTKWYHQWIQFSKTWARKACRM